MAYTRYSIYAVARNKIQRNSGMCKSKGIFLSNLVPNSELMVKLHWFNLFLICCEFVYNLLYNKSTTNRTSALFRQGTSTVVSIVNLVPFSQVHHKKRLSLFTTRWPWYRSSRDSSAIVDCHIRKQTTLSCYIRLLYLLYFYTAFAN